VNKYSSKQQHAGIHDILFFLEIYHYFLEFNTIISILYWNITCPFQSKGSQFVRRTYPNLKMFQILFIYRKFEGVEVLEGSEKVPANHTIIFSKLDWYHNFLEICVECLLCWMKNTKNVEKYENRGANLLEFGD
jgi:hypothetical protein